MIPSPRKAIFLVILLIIILFIVLLIDLLIIYHENSKVSALKMTTKSDYTEAEWRTIKLAAIASGFAVAMADMGVFSSAIEGSTLGTELSQAGISYPNNELIKSLFSQGEKVEAVNVKVEEIGTNPQEAVDKAKALIIEAIGILQQKSPEELSEYKEFCLHLAEKVANASGEGLFGTGPKVSSKEKVVIENLKAVLA